MTLLPLPNGDYFPQDYVREIFDAAYAGAQDCVVDGDVSYGRRGGSRTTDTVIFEAYGMIFVEVVEKLVNLKGAVLELDEASKRNSNSWTQTSKPIETSRPFRSARAHPDSASSP